MNLTTTRSLICLKCLICLNLTTTRSLIYLKEKKQTGKQAHTHTQNCSVDRCFL